MVMMPHNWKVEFQNAAGQNVFVASGHASAMTTDIKTPETFLFQGLVQIEEVEMRQSDMGCDVEPVRDHWNKAVVNAQDFGISDVEIAKPDVTEATIQSAQVTAEANLTTQPEPKFM